jgi:adenylate kinase family enzyme
MRERRIVVIGNTCAGKSTLGDALAKALSVRFVDLDALFWKPNWQKPELAEFRAKVDEATRERGWVVAGNYTTQRDISWPRADTVVWLDVPLLLVVKRVLTRSFGRWRSQELLWGTNHESFLSHLKVWDEEASLIAWAVRHHLPRRRSFEQAMTDPQWAHLKFIRFTSNRAATKWMTSL